MTEHATGRAADGSAGDADYGTIGAGYSRYRRPDPRIAAAVSRALGDARTVINVGGGGPGRTSRPGRW
ncbi:hypothetical protein GCM10020000_64290 [Streptomyces olivoverticillatus]